MGNHTNVHKAQHLSRKQARNRKGNGSAAKSVKDHTNLLSILSIHSSRHFTGRFTNFTVFNRLVACVFRAHSARKGPSLNLFILFRVPAIAWTPFCIAKGDSLLRDDSSLAEVITKYLGQLSLLMYSFYCPSQSSSLSFVQFVSFVCQQKKPYLEGKKFITLSPHPFQQGNA